MPPHHSLKNRSLPTRQIFIEQTHCAMTCQGCGVSLRKLKSSKNQVPITALLSYVTRQHSNRINIPVVYDKNSIFSPGSQVSFNARELLCKAAFSKLPLILYGRFIMKHID